MKVKTAIFLFSIALSGCQTTPSVPVSELNNFEVCEKYIEGSYRYSSSELRSELMERGENCQQYLPILQARAQASAAQGALGMQLLQQAQPRPAPVQSINNINCRSVPGSGGQVNTSCW